MRKPGTPKGFAERKSRYRAKMDTSALPPETMPDGTVLYFLKLGPKGRVLLPVEMRLALELEVGDQITAWVKDGELRLHSYVHGLRRIRDEAAALAKKTGYASDELIAERRAEVLKETEEEQYWSRQSRRKRR
jgi:bifunctional DNA-binding transcriptional regulator/antitoxin component of YhaV-PrlF toxin-antitoxin module